MSGFSAEWLALRAPADDAARDRELVAKLCAWADGRALNIADLGGGSGAATRALRPLLPDATWRVFDDNAELLALLPEGAEGVSADLSASLDPVFDPNPDLITAFAFLDLVSEAFVERLAARAAAAGAAVYAPLTYDGVEAWRPDPPHEAEALAAFNRDMRRDKGFGPALGSGATDAMANALSARGYRVWVAPSPWRLSAGELMTMLAEGAADAVKRALDPDAFTAWRAGRLSATEAEIGHFDLLALPAQ